MTAFLRMGRLAGVLRSRGVAAVVFVLGGLPAAVRRRTARLLRGRIPEVSRELDAIPADRLARTVLFVSPQPHVRESRIAAAARIAGWTPVLVYVGKLRSGHEREFALRLRVESLFQLVLATWYYEGAVVHVFALSGSPADPIVRSKVRPTALDLYDTCSGMGWATPRARRAERRSIRRADGITHRDLRVKYLQRRHGYELPRCNVFVPDLLERPRLRPRPARESDDIHVVSIGWIDDMDNSIREVATAFVRAGIHVHAYVSPFQRADPAVMRAYEDLAAASSYFRIEEPVYGESYWEHLARYDFGLCVFEPDLLGRPPTRYTLDYLRGCSSARLVDYIAAGLGVIVSRRLMAYQYAFARRYASLVVVADHELIADPRKVLGDAVRRRDPAARRDITAITPHGVADRVDRFYTRLAGADGRR